MRAALHQLEYEGLVYSVPRGYFVTNPSPEEITRFFLRKKLEGLAAEQLLLRYHLIR